MKKLILLLVIVALVVTSVSISFAQETVRKKVVKVRPTQIESTPTPVKTTRIQPKQIEETESGSTAKQPPKAQPVASGVGTEGAGRAEKGPSGFFAALKGGFALPRYFAGVEVGTTFAREIMQRTDLGGRLGVAYQKGFDVSSAITVYGDVFLSWDVLRSASLPLTLNLGAGINYPVSVQENQTGALGFNIFLGLNYDIWEKGQLFVESGFHTFARKDKDTLNGVSCLVGYKHFF